MPSGSICKVDGCHGALTTSYCRKHQACRKCRRAVVVLLQGGPCRWCQQCARFHPVSFFDGNKRACREKLALMKQRRREADAAFMAAYGDNQNAGNSFENTPFAIGWAADKQRCGPAPVGYGCLEDTSSGMDHGQRYQPAVHVHQNHSKPSSGLKSTRCSEQNLLQLFESYASDSSLSGRPDTAGEKRGEYDILQLIGSMTTPTPTLHRHQPQQHGQYNSGSLNITYTRTTSCRDLFDSFDNNSNASPKDPSNTCMEGVSVTPSSLYLTGAVTEPLSPQTSSATSTVPSEQGKQQIRWATRVSLQLAGCLPHELPPDMHQQLLQVVSTNSTNALQQLLSWS